MSSFDYLDLCRLCLVKDQVSVPIFEGDGDARQIFHKISFCLPVKVDREDKLPKKICDDCAYKVELCYQFYNTTANAEKQLLQWLGEVGLEDKQDYEQEVMNSDMMKQEPDNRINVTVLSSEEQSNNMEINMIDGMSLSLPIIMTNQQMPAVSMSSTDNLQNIQSVAGTSVQTTRRMQKDGGHEEIEDTEEDDNSEDECDVDEGMQVVKEESENSTSGSRSMEPTTFVNVALSCNEAGPSGLQQQKLGEISEMGIQQSSEGDTKTGDGKDLLVDSERSTTGGSKKKHKGRDRVRGKKKAPYRCETCAENFETELDLLAHHTTIDDISCCHSETPRASRRRSHRRSRGHSSKSDTNDSDGKQSRPSTPVKNHQLKCFDCQKTFKKKKYLKVHMALHGSPHVCHICGAKKTSEYDLNIHVRRHNKEFTEFCPVCKKGFYLKANLKNHMSRHTSVKPFECDVCKKPFGNQIYLKSHMRIHSQPDTRKKYTCSICEFETFYSYCFKEHMWTHTGEGQLPCQYCGKLIRRDYMKIHIRIHTGEKPEVCEFCGRTFASRRYLVKHRRIHTGEKPYKCHRCDRAFTQRGTLTSHLRTHRTPPPLP